MDIRMSIIHRAALAVSPEPEMAFAPPTISKLFVPVTGYSKLLKSQKAVPTAPPPGASQVAQPEVLSERMRLAARRAHVNFKRDANCGYEMSQAVLRDCGGRRDFTKPRWVGQQMRRGQALERLVHDGYVEVGMVLWFSNAPGADSNRLDPRCNHMFYTCVGLDERGKPEFAGQEADQIPYEVLTAKLRLLGCALDRAFPFVTL